MAHIHRKKETPLQAVGFEYKGLYARNPDFMDFSQNFRGLAKLQMPKGTEMEIVLLPSQRERKFNPLYVVNPETWIPATIATLKDLQEKRPDRYYRRIQRKIEYLETLYPNWVQRAPAEKQSEISLEWFELKLALQIHLAKLNMLSL